MATATLTRAPDYTSTLEASLDEAGLFPLTPDERVTVALFSAFHLETWKVIDLLQRDRANEARMC